MLCMDCHLSWLSSFSRASCKRLAHGTLLATMAGCLESELPSLILYFSGVYQDMTTYRIRLVSEWKIPMRCQAPV